MYKIELIYVLTIIIVVLYKQSCAIVYNDNYGDLKLIDSQQINQLNDEKKLFALITVSDYCDKICDEKIVLINKLKQLIESEVEIYATKDQKLLDKYAIIKYPTLLLFREAHYVMYKGELTNHEELVNWINGYKQKYTFHLNDATFEHDTQASTGSTTGDWFVLFHKNDCGTKTLIEDAFEQVAVRLRNRVLFAYVNYDENPNLQERFHLFKSPTMIFFRKGAMHRYDLERITVETLEAFTDGGWYRNIRAEPVPKEVTTFDRLTEYIVRELKAGSAYFWYPIYAVAGVFALLILYFVIFKICKKRLPEGLTIRKTNNRFKFD